MKYWARAALAALILLLCAYAVNAGGSGCTSNVQTIRDQAGIDTVAVPDSDSAHIDLDSLKASTPKQRSMLARLVLPLAATALAGGILLLLFTQRGR